MKLFKVIVHRKVFKELSGLSPGNNEKNSRSPKRDGNKPLHEGHQIEETVWHEPQICARPT